MALSFHRMNMFNTLLLLLLWFYQIRSYSQDLSEEILKKKSSEIVNWIDLELNKIFVHFDFLQFSFLAFGAPVVCLLSICLDKSYFDLTIALLYGIFIILFCCSFVISQFNVLCTKPNFEILKDSVLTDENFCNSVELKEIVVTFCKLKSIYLFTGLFFLCALFFNLLNLKFFAIISIIFSLLCFLISFFITFVFYLRLEKLLINKNKTVWKKK